MMVFSQTDRGPREQNQDFFLVEEFSGSLYLVVADGVGGNKGGQTASRTACENFMAALKSGCSPKDAILSAHDVVLDLASKNQELTGMATTLTCVVVKGGRAYGVHSGDSRVYLLRKNGVKQVTQDHSEVARLLLSGKLTKAEASTYPRRNVLYSAVGTNAKFVFQEFDFELEDGDRILVMTDGVYSVLPKRDFRDLSLASSDFNEYCKAVMDRVVGGKTKDNYTLVGVEISDIHDEVAS